MSRKFIAGVLAASLVVTGFSAAPLRAAEARDVAKVIGGAALVYMIGKAVSEAREADRERDRKDKERTKALQLQAAQQEHSWRAPDPRPHLPRPYRFEDRHGQFAQPSHARPKGVLPGACLREVRGERGAVMQRSCLRSAAIRTDALPDRCEKKIRIGKDKEHVFSAQCLQKAGWRIGGPGVRNGHDRHGAWHPGRQQDRHYDGRRN